MRTLLVHPSGLMYSEIFLRLEPLGLERVAGAARAAGHQVRLLDLQVFGRDDRKRASVDDNMRALEVARELGLIVAVNLIVDPAWDTGQFALVRRFAESVPEIVHLSVKTPYPGTEIWHTEAQKLTSLDYRLFDIQHAVLPTTLPLPEFYRELVRTQAVINRKHLGVAGLAQAFGIAGRLLLRGQTNFVRMLWQFSRVYNETRQLADHDQAVRYELPVPDHRPVGPQSRSELYIHPRRPRRAPAQ